MANRRMIASDVFEDEFVGFLNFFGRLIWIGMIVSCADDQGRLLDSSPLIRSKVFPYDKNIADDKIDEVLAKAATEGKIVRYEAAGKPLLQIVHWWEYQQPAWASPSKYPAPEGWTDRVRYHTVGNKILPINWDEPGGFSDGYKAVEDIPLRSAMGSPLRSGIEESKDESEIEIKSESLSLSGPIVEFLKLAGLQKFPKGHEQQLAVLVALIKDHGEEKTLGCARWLWQKSDMTLARAISSMVTAVPGWTIDKSPPKVGGNGGVPRPPVVNGFAAELQKRLQENGNGIRS